MGNNSNPKELLMADIVIEELGSALLAGQPAEAVHGAWYKFAGQWGENSALKRASDHANSARDKLAAINDFRANRNPETAIEVHARKVARLVDEFGREWAGQWDTVKSGLKSEASRVTGELDRAANLKADPALLNATLGTFQSMKPEQRVAAIDELLTDPSGGPVLAILVEKPGVLTGLSAEQRELIKERAYAKADPNGHALLKSLKSALQRAEATSLACIADQQKLRDGTNRYDAKVERAQALEAKVTAGFSA
jgi:hypothetical protein